MPMTCSRCGYDAGSAKFCPECGHALSRSCGQCLAPVALDAKFCAQCGARIGEESSAPSRRGEPDAGERRQLTVLFCDLVGSTEIAAQLDPEDWHRISKDYQQAAAAAVQRFGGHVDKFLGDGLVCFFGVPQAHEDDAERAVRAGLAIVDAVQGVNHGSTDDQKRLRVRVGLHTGAAVVAHGGGDAKDVFGDTPNVAARVQSVAEPDTVFISSATQRLVAGLFVVEDRGAQRLKGVPDPVTLYRVVQPSGVRSRLEVSAGRHTRFVGRQTQLATLREAWERVADGMGQTVLVQGEAGLGKSRLCYELRLELAGEPHTWLECRCSPYTVGTAFRPVIELVEQALTFQAADTPGEKLDKLRLGLARGGFAADEAAPLLAEWLELPESAGYAPLRLTPDAKRRKALEILAAWNLKLAELQPMVVLVEDLHWCDPSSLELLSRLVAQSATARVLLLGTARPEFTSPWPVRSNVQTVTLGRLTKRQTREMIATLSANRALPEEVLEQLVTRVDGIPLFAEELTQAVVEAGSDAAVAAIPVTLQDSLVARLDRLSSAKEVAQRAAVLGREFSYALLAATAGLDDGALQQGLARLADAELIFVRGVPPEATYTFKHALVQEAAYESLLKRTRQQLHGRVVDVLVAEFPERAAAAPEVVARHAEIAGRTDDAIAYHQRAGDHAQARSAHTEAIGHLRKTITLLATRPEGAARDAREAAVQLTLAGSLRPARGIAHVDTEAAYERARVLCEGTSDVRRLGLALGGLASFYSNAGNPARGATLATRVLELAERSDDRELAILGGVELAVAESWLGKLRSAVDHFDAARRIYEAERRTSRTVTADGGTDVMPLSYLDLRIIALAQGAWSLGPLGYPDRALANAREAVALARELRDPFNLAFALAAESIVHALRRDLTAQRARAEEAIAVSETNGFPLFLGLGRVYQAAARVAAGESAAVADVLDGLSMLSGTGSQAGAPSMLGLLADTYMAAGTLVDAQGAVELGFAIAEQTGQPSADCVLHRLQGELVLRMGNGSLPTPEVARTAEECFRRALDVARAQEVKYLELPAAMSLARLWRDQGRRTEARDLLAPLYAWFTEGFDTQDLKAARALLGELA